MQKLDYTEALIKLTKTLHTNKIVNYLDQIPLNSPIEPSELTSLLVSTKSNFDKIEIESDEYEILKVLDGPKIYDQGYISNLITLTSRSALSNEKKIHLYLKTDILEFYQLHHTLFQAKHLSQSILFKDDKLLSLDSKEVIVFRVRIGEHNLELSSYSKILKLLGELIEIFEKTFNPSEKNEPNIVLLDSGSDTNFGVKSSFETVNALFQIFEKVWTWIVDRKFYKNKLRNDTMLQNLAIFKAIKEAEKNDDIDTSTAKIYRESILRKTEDLLELNVIPKRIVDSEKNNSSKKVLDEYSEAKKLDASNGKK